MASDAKVVEFIVGQMARARAITYRKMFGEYALYHDGKVFGFVCDNQLFFKPTEAGRALIRDVVEAPPWPTAKPHFLIGEGIDDMEWLANLVRVTARALPVPKAKPVAKATPKTKAKPKSKTKAATGSKDIPNPKPREKKSTVKQKH